MLEISFFNCPAPSERKILGRFMKCGFASTTGVVELGVKFGTTNDGELFGGGRNG